MIVINSPEDLRRIPRVNTRALVPTMGALHEGHLALISKAREQVGSQGEVIVSLFVNPTQFSRHEDLDKYPRTFESDRRKCEEAGVDILFAPSVHDIYPQGNDLSQLVSVAPHSVANILEGRDRPGHFEGVLTVVAKLFNMTQPDIALFGEKDYQQLTLINAMARDLNFALEVVGVPTVRDADGLALSSRNVFLTESELVVARSLSAAILAAQRRDGTVKEKLDTAVEIIDPRASVFYLAAMSDDLVTDLQDSTLPAGGRLLIAAQVGDIRLIDNCPIVPAQQSAVTT